MRPQKVTPSEGAFFSRENGGIWVQWEILGDRLCVVAES